MLLTNTINSSNLGCSDWPHQLFYQSNGLYQNSAQIKKNVFLTRSELALEENQQSSEWSKRLFASAATGLQSYDKLLVMRDRKMLCEFEFRSDRAEVLIGNNYIVDVMLEAPKVSQFHAKVSCIKGQYQIEDLGSEHGTYLNGNKLTPNKAVELLNGSSVRIMAFQILFELQERQFPKTPSLEPRKSKSEICPDPVKESFDHCPVSSDLFVEPQMAQPWCKGITELLVTDIIDETHEVKTFRLSGITPLSFSYLPGQYVTLLLSIEGKEVERSYSMSSSPSRPHTLDLTVKRVSGGLVSNWLCDRVRAGDKLKVKGPIGHFSFLQKPTQKLLLIGAGSGTTPLMSMSRWLFDTASSVDAKALFSFRSRKDVIFRKELEMMAESGNRVDIAITLTGKQGRHRNWKGFSGRIDKAMLEAFAKDLNDRDVFLCGPEAFMNDVKNLLETLNYPMRRLRCESFCKVPSLPITHEKVDKSQIKSYENTQTGKQGTWHTITFAKSNKVVKVDENTDLLQLAEGAGIEMDYDCKSGSCGECMIKCLSGQVEMNDACDIDDHEREQGLILGCCAFARSDVTLNV